VLKTKIAIFFTYDYSVDVLKKAGIFQREMKIYDELYKTYGTKFIFITYDDINNDSLNEYPHFEFISVYSYITKSNNKFFRLLKSFTIPFLISKDLKNVDILHQHQLLGSWVAILIKLILRKPLLIRTGYDAYLFSVNNNDPKPKSLFYKYLTRISLYFSDLYTVTSNCDYKFLANSFNESKIRVVPNWVENSSSNVSKRLSNKILLVGRLEDQKNYPLALEFSKRVNALFELDIFGSGAQLNNLKNISMKEGMKVNFHGNIPHEKLMKVYRKYDYFLSTSFYEGNPKTVLEALSNECVVFATNIPNHSEIINDGVNGYLFDDITELIEKFEFIFTNEAEKLKMQKHASNSIKNNQLNSVVELMNSDYRSLIPLR
jgi:glycosyltransferase involved in cell wall biosynthesis